MNVNIRIERTLEVPVAHDKARTLFDDIESTLRRFPKLRKLTRLAEDTYLWEMSAIGSKAAGISHEVRYAAQYSVDTRRGLLSWKPVAGQGNASIEGRFELTGRGGHTRLVFSVKGELRDVPVPLMYRLLAPPFIQGKFTRLVDIFLEQTREALLKL